MPKRNTVLIFCRSNIERHIGKILMEAIRADSLRQAARIKFYDARSCPNPDLVVSICDYKCEINRCITRFALLLRWKHLSVMLIRPLLDQTCCLAQRTFLYTDLIAENDKYSERTELLQRFKGLPLFACSGTWPIHPTNSVYKTALVQKETCKWGSRTRDLIALARLVSWTPAWLSHEFYKNTGIKLKPLLIKQNMCRALWLLLSTEFSIKTICDHLGYQDALYLSKVFRKRFGIPPSETRKLVYKNMEE